MLRQYNPQLDADIINAVESQDSERVKKFLEEGANPNATVKTPSRNLDQLQNEEIHLLDLAISSGTNDIVEMLLKNGADPFLKDSNSKTSVQSAILSRRFDALILIHHSRPLDPDILGKALWHALHEHPHQWEAQILKLIERGANVNYTRAHQSHLSDKKEYISCLTLAARYASTVVITNMLAHGANPALAMNLDEEKNKAFQEALNPFLQKQVVDAFEKIYTALREGQSGLFKTNFLSKLQNLSLHEKINAITEHAKEASSRTAKAWELAQAHHNNATSVNEALVDGIYNWSFSHSGLFKRSTVTGTTFFKSRALQLSPENIMEAFSNNPNSRTARIVKALS